MTTSTAHATLTMPVVPDAIKVSPKETLLFSTQGRGFQIYEWLPKQSEWTHVPEADLFDAQGKKIGHHYAGPTWESNDGSKVVCDLKAHVASPDANAAPWLLLIVKKHEGEGIMSRVTSIQRLETVGGGEPPVKDGPAKVGQKVPVPYTATYYYYGSK